MNSRGVIRSSCSSPVPASEPRSALWKWAFGRCKRLFPPGSDGTSGVLRLYALGNMLLCMRTTIDITDELLRRAKRRAVDDGIPLRAVIEAALRGYLQGGRLRAAYRLRWRTETGRLQPGVNLDDRDALFDLMGGRR